MKIHLMPIVPISRKVFLFCFFRVQITDDETTQFVIFPFWPKWRSMPYSESSRVRILYWASFANGLPQCQHMQRYPKVTQTWTAYTRWFYHQKSLQSAVICQNILVSSKKGMHYNLKKKVASNIYAAPGVPSHTSSYRHNLSHQDDLFRGIS